MKKVLSIVLAILASSLLYVSAFAVEQPCDTLTLYPEQTEKYVNSAITAKSKKLTGVVYSSSTRSVYFRMRYKIDTVTYTTDTALLIAPQTTNNWFYDRSSSNNLSSKAYWRFELDNYGVATKGGFAQGWMW